MAILWHGDPTFGTPPYPGSKRALTAGCLCSPWVNMGGKGVQSGIKDTKGRPVFEVHNSCGVHAATTDDGAIGSSATFLAVAPAAQIGGAG